MGGVGDIVGAATPGLSNVISGGADGFMGAYK
jgi:hypothetical protein